MLVERKIKIRISFDSGKNITYHPLLSENKGQYFMQSRALIKRAKIEKHIYLT